MESGRVVGKVGGSWGKCEGRGESGSSTKKGGRLIVCLIMYSAVFTKTASESAPLFWGGNDLPFKSRS